VHLRGVRMPHSTIVCSTFVLVLVGTRTVVAQPKTGAGNPLTEQEYVAHVLAESLDARIVESEAGLARAEGAGAGLWPNPSVEWERQSAGSPAVSSERQDVVVASIPLVLSGRLGLERDAASLGAQSAQARADRARAELRWRAIRAFSAVLATREREAILTASLQAMDGLARAIAIRERAGDAAGYDRLRIEVERAALAGQLRAARAGAARAFGEALRLLGPSAQTLPPLRGTLAAERPVPELETLLAEVERRRADARALELDARAAGNARRAAARSWIPDPTVSAGAQFLHSAPSGPTTGYVVGLSVPIPLFQHGQREQARAEANRNLAATRRALLLHSARNRLVSAFQEVAGRREQLARHRSEVLARTEELRRVAGAGYRGGASDLLVLVDAERAAREAQLANVDLGFGVVEAETDLLLLSGAYDAAPERSAPR
jgi:cobalt-zinc-cadmium efflux system outer membrane protein